MSTDKKNIFLNILTDSSSIPNTLLDHYLELGLTEKETLFLIILLRLNHKHSSLTIKTVARESVYSETEVMNTVPILIDKGFLSLSEGGEILLDGMIEKFFELKSWNAVRTEQKIRKYRKIDKDDQYYSELYQCFEQEMGRPLSPIEGDQIIYWYKDRNYSVELIKLALTRAVLIRKNNFRYINAILESWEKQGFHTVSDVEQAEANQKQKQKQYNDSKENRHSFRSSQNKDGIFPDEIYEVFK